MLFTDFLNLIPAILPIELPSQVSHLKMAPKERTRLMEEAQQRAIAPRYAAVMMLIYPKSEVSHLALILRNSYPGVHSSQVAFPGGKVELEDDHLEMTALRETHEEIGIPPNHIKVMRSFSEVYIPPSNFVVQPFLGYSQSELVFVPQPEEVAGIIEMPLAALLDESILIEHRLSTSYANDIDVPAFKVDNHVVWGATAMMLSELKDVLMLALKR
jgi:8-oxo-dGTP pyrophosphatase MutT (NUDIX family)